MIALKPFATNSELARISRRYVWSLPVVAILGMMSGLLEGVGIGLLIPLLGTLLGSTQGPRGGVVGLLDRFAEGLAANERLVAVAVAMLGLVLLKNLLQMVSHVLVAHVDGHASDDIRRALAERLLKASYVFHLDKDAARLVNIVATESWHASDAIRADFSRIESAAVASIFIVMLFFVNWPLTLVVIVGVVLLRFLQAALLRPVQRHGESVVSSNADLFERMLATIYQTRTIRLFRREADEQQRFDDCSAEVRRSMFVVARLSAFVWPVLEVARVGLFLAILLVAAFKRIPFPELAALLVLLNRVQPHLRTVEDTTTALATANAQVAEVEWLLSAVDTQRTSSTGRKAFTRLRREITFRDVTFNYPSRPDVPSLKGVTFSIAAGRSTALIGRSGSGKSTVINLLCRLIQPTSGMILVDGEPIETYDIADWLGNIGIAGQDIDLAGGTVEDNIRFGRAGLSTADIESAARHAEADTFIRALPDGYATRIGVGGLGLSGGQRQRIGIARAIARQPSLLILDEATNSVDSLSEAAIFDLLHRLPSRPTLIVISHRPSTLTLCDDAIVIDEGSVVEESSLASSKAYRRLAAIG